MAKSKRRQMNSQNYNKTQKNNTEFAKENMVDYEKRKDMNQSMRDEENNNY